MKTSVARRPEACLTNCHAYSMLPLNFRLFALRSLHFGFWLDCSPVWWCIQAHFLPNSQEDGVVQLPFRPALRLRLFSNGLRAPSFLSSLSSNLFLSAFRWNLRLLWLLNSLNTLLLEERQNSSRWSHQAVWDFSHFGSRLVVVSITTFCYGFTRTCLHRNISRNREIHWIEHSWTSCRRRRLWICKNVSRYTMRIPKKLAAKFSLGLAILLVHEEEEIT